jgi:hypothetical protein
MIDAYLANVPTPLMFGGFLALTVGNFLIGILEARVLEWRYDAKPTNARVGLIVANYATAAVGYVLAPWILRLWQGVVDRMGVMSSEMKVLAIAWVATFLFTALCEIPFAKLVLKSAPHPASAVKASLLMNLASYAIMVPLAFMFSHLGPLELSGLRTREEMSRPLPAGDIVYVSVDGMKILRAPIETAGPPITLQENPEPLRSSHHQGLHVRVFKYPKHAKGEKRLELAWRFDDQPLIAPFDPKGRVEKMVKLLDGGGRVQIGAYSSRRFEEGYLQAIGGYWPGYDLIVQDTSGAQPVLKFSLGFQTPFLIWTWMHPTTLPDGWCVATQRDRVYLIDLKNREICQLAEGFGAMAILRE